MRAPTFLFFLGFWLVACAESPALGPPEPTVLQTPYVQPKSLVLLVGQTAELQVHHGPGQHPSFFAEPPGVVSVNDQGLVLATQTGAAAITVSFPDTTPLEIPVQVFPAPQHAEGCLAADPRDLTAFPSCPTGGGIFGQWIVDDFGLPAFSYTLDHRTDPRAIWPHSEAGVPMSKVRRDHFIVLGNQRINFLAVNDGYINVYTHERAPTFLNRFDEDERDFNMGGGFSYVNDSNNVYATAYRYSLSRADGRRVFGSFYFRTENTHNGLRIRHTLHAPSGNDPVVLDDVEIENLTGEEKQPRHFEYFDANRHQLLIQWVRTGLAAAPSDKAREQLNAQFVQASEYDPEKRILFVTMNPKTGTTRPPADTPSAQDMYPPILFLAALQGRVDASYGDQNAFFGKGSRFQPDAVTFLSASSQLAPQSALGQPALLVLRSDLKIPPFGKQKLRFAFGTVSSAKGDSEKEVRWLDKYRQGDALSVSQSELRKQLVYAYTPKHPLLHREAMWHAAQLLGNTVYSDYYKVSYTPQGSAYLYLHGADGVPRDQALFSLALSYVAPALAKGNLRLLLSLQQSATGKLPYSMTNFGQHDGALIHENPSDLDLFLFLAVGEYLAATGDMKFLEEELPFHPRGSPPPAWVGGNTVLDHLRVAFRHLKDKVGLGPNGLVRIHDGDWSDGIVYEDLSPTAIAFTQAYGESVPNSQMALYVLPLLANQIASRVPQFAAELTQYADALRTPVRRTFGGRWFGRAWLRNTWNQPYLKGNDRTQDKDGFIDLEAQPWGLLVGPLLASERENLLDEVKVRLDDSSPIGPVLREGGMVWPAISQLQTWAYAKHRPLWAWRSLVRHFRATHAQQWPAIWPGVFSAPDGFNSKDGQTWASPVTPMTDFPVANMNDDAMFLFGLLRTCGISPNPDGKGLDFAPLQPDGYTDYVVDTALIRLEAQTHRIALEYRTHNDVDFVLRLFLPTSATSSSLRLRINGELVLATLENGFVPISIKAKSGQRFSVEARF